MKNKIFLLLIPLLLLLVFLPKVRVSDVAQDNDAGETIFKGFEVELASMSRAEVKTRDASVAVYTPTGGHGSGAYFLFEGHHVIFTARHLVDKGDVYMVVDKFNNERIGEVIYRDSNHDFAILLIPHFKKTKPLRFRLPQYNIRDKVGMELIYSGFPSKHNLTTISGYVAGLEDPFILMHAAAWMGSSGSCIFDESGGLVGILFAITVGKFRDQPVLIEDLVWVLPFSEINWNAAREALTVIN